MDLQTMHESARRALGPGDGYVARPSALEELDTLTLALRGHLALLLPEVERTARLAPRGVQSYCALACVDEARRKLGIAQPSALEARVAHARRLARSLNALCQYYELLRRAVL
ncbi:DUF6415 family natural product biosynthesis protein [Streptomyces chartreusis]|uniref:DUF6415 family natural product biosynthesis protein n=1 Tax=Streptomyces chartreusis TaxID=1969 RepID=UPI0036589709